jgi:hypothetical protein
MALTHAVDRRSLIQALSTDVAKPSLVVRRFRPTMRNGILDQTWRNTRAWRDDIGDTLLMDNKVANCQNTIKHVIELVTKIAPQRSQESFLFISNRFFPSLPMCWSIFLSKTVFLRSMTSTKQHAFSFWHAHCPKFIFFYTHKISRCAFFLLRFLLQPNVEHECCKFCFLTLWVQSYKLLSHSQRGNGFQGKCFEGGLMIFWGIYEKGF